MRLFLAINLDPRIRREIVEATAPLRVAAPSASWVEDHRLHLTLKFLGEQADDRVEPLRATLDDVARRHKPFSMRVGDVGAFPNFRRARVVWMGVEREPRLELLHHDIEVACEALGFELEGRAFRPHLTLARLRAERVDEDEMRRLSRAGKQVTYSEESVVHSIDLMHSVPAGTGPNRYERLHAAALQGTGGGR